MSDTPTTDPNTDPEHIKNLRERADKAAGLEASSAAKDREIAFLKAGVNTGSAFGKMVMQSFGDDAEITPDAIKEAVTSLQTELGLPSENTPPPEPGTDPASPEGQLAAARSTLETGNPAIPEPPAPKPIDERAYDTMLEARRKGMTLEESQAAGIGEIIRAAAEGNVDVVYSEDAFKAEAEQHGHGAEFAGYPERSYTPIVTDTPKANVA